MDAVIVKQVCKNFKRYTSRQPRRSLKEVLLHPMRPAGSDNSPEMHREVLHDISFSIPPGMTVGIIGRNGSGKTTLLKLISGIYRADSGRISVSGRLSTLLGLGLGFHPELTGRENIFINGLILGLSRREIRESFQDMVDFAGLQEFIDAPVRTYSSGMYVRLAFSIAVNVDPDVLLLDEVLAVGDADFQLKCRKRMEEFRRQGKTILLVTHDMGAAETWCERLLLLDKGRLVADGKPHEVVDLYLQKVQVG